MTLDDLKTRWAEDCQLDDIDIGKSARETPMLHSFYLNELITYKLKLAKVQKDLTTTHSILAKYYRGDMTQGELVEFGRDQWQYKSLKAEIENLIDADPLFQDNVLREQYIKTAIYFLESVMGEIKSRSFTIKSMLDWQKFRAGA